MAPVSLQIVSLARVLIAVAVVIIAPIVVAVAIPTTGTVHALIIAAEECIAIVIAFWSGYRRIAILGIVPGVHVAMCLKIALGGFDPLVEGTPSNVVVVVGWLNIPLNYLCVRTSKAARHWHTCQAQKKYRSYKANCVFHRCPHIRAKD